MFYQNENNVTYLLITMPIYPLSVKVLCIKSLKKEIADGLFGRNFNAIGDYGLNELQEKLTDTKTTAEEKNSVYEQIKTINTNSGLEETIEKKIKEQYSCETFAKIEESSVKIVVDKCENSKKLANNIMRLVQEQFDSKMYISVQFES